MIREKKFVCFCSFLVGSHTIRRLTQEEKREERRERPLSHPKQAQAMKGLLALAALLIPSAAGLDIFSYPTTTLPTTGQKVTGTYSKKTATFHGKVFVARDESYLLTNGHTIKATFEGEKK